MTDIRRTTSADWAAYRDLRLRSLQLAPGAFGSTFADESTRPDHFWVERVTVSHTLLAWDGDSAIGTATGIPDHHEDGSREIVGVWVEPSARGRGVGEALILALVDSARDAAAPAIALWVSDGNDAARRMYERCGFAGTGQRDVVRGDLWEERMRRALS